MSENSEPRIIIAENFLELEHPQVIPFMPPSLRELFNQALIHNAIPGYNRRETEAVLIQKTYLYGLGQTLIDRANSYFMMAENKITIPQVEISVFSSFDQKDEENKQRLDALYHSLGIGEQAYVDATLYTISETLGTVSDDTVNVCYAFTMVAGQSYMNVMSRLWTQQQTEIYQDFMNAALTYKIAGCVLREASTLYEDEGVVLPLRKEDFTWKNLVSRTATQIDIRYMSLNL